MRTRFIFNPAAGSAESINELLALLKRETGCDHFQTERAGHAGELARAAIEQGVQRIIAAGGDGTINEIVNGIAPHFDRVELAIIPVGTGNDLARTLEIPTEPAQALEVALRAPAKPIDVARFRGPAERWFLNTSAGGFAGVVNHYASDENKQRWGSLAYLASAVAALRDVIQYELEMQIDGQAFAIRAYNIIVANGRFAGGGIPVAPEARLNDGNLDVVVLPAAPLAESALGALQILLGHQNPSDKVLTFQAKQLAISAKPQLPFNVDGELVGETDAHFEVLPRAARIVAGPECAALA